MDNTETDTKKSHTGALVAIGVIAAIAVIAALAFAFLGGKLPGSNAGNIDVPDVTNKTLEQATSLIQEKKLVVGVVDYVYSDKVPSGSVVSQSPLPGSKQAEGTKINLSVSQGVEQVDVPDLTNMTADEARSALKRVGLGYEAGPAEHSSTVKENHIVRQSPKAGEKVAKNSVVTYYLSAGEETVAVPNVVGEYEGSAQTILGNAGFSVTVDYRSSNDVEEGAVISQSPSAGEKAKTGSSVNIVVSTGAKYYSASAYVNNTSAGEVSPSSMNVVQGGSVTFYITAYSGYAISHVSDSNGNSYGATSSVTLNNIQGDVTVSVVFESSGGGGGEEESSSSASPSHASPGA